MNLLATETAVSSGLTHAVDKSYVAIANPYDCVRSESRRRKVERTGLTGGDVLNADGIVRYEQVADHPGDRTYGNFVRYYIRGRFADPFDGA
ncbi:hypothetical protein [Haloplanus rubicundus]|uniref:hypothetical protein n=1 Tax=Haloplanus rubicundus TaxID=1547898 RepID=UPI0021CB8D2D|nr:hypothetical protein [Haloplanus rubicundus]